MDEKNSGDPDQLASSDAADLHLYCFPKRIKNFDMDCGLTLGPIVQSIASLIADPAVLSSIWEIDNKTFSPVILLSSPDSSWVGVSYK